MNRFMPLWATVTVSAVVVGCGTSEPMNPMRRGLLQVTPATAPAACGSSVKDIKVKDITIVSSTRATIKITQRVKIDKNKAGANWKLETAGYVFAPAGVVIDMPPGPAESYSNATNEFGWCFNTTADWESKYTIYLRAIQVQIPTPVPPPPPAPPVTWKCDPVIANYGGELLSSESTVSCSVVPVSGS